MILYTATLDTPLGPFSFGVDDTGALHATTFGSARDLAHRLRSVVRWQPDTVATAPVRRELEAYFAGRRLELKTRAAGRGTDFQARVWAAVRRIPPGETRSYGDIARELGVPGASRAVGRANATNPVCLFVPCHRVVGSDGSLTGYAFGAERKRWLLEHERGS